MYTESRAEADMDADRPQLYFFLLPFSTVSLFIYVQILIEIHRKRMYSGFFFRMLCSQSLYDISYVVMYFVMELPQEWRQLNSFFLIMNNTIIPQLIYAHTFMCAIGQILGIAMMAISRMLLVCHPLLNITKFLRRLSTKQVVLFHCIIPAAYACYIVIGHGWRSYVVIRGRISRAGEQSSMTINSRVLCMLGLIGSLSSALCYIRIFLTLRKRPIRSWRNELYILITSFVLFCALCTFSAFYVANVVIRATWEDSILYYALRKQAYAFTFLLSLANPWCLMISSASLRSSVLHRCLPSCCFRRPFSVSLFSPHTIPSIALAITKTAGTTQEVSTI